MGLAVHKPRCEEDNYAIIYYPLPPAGQIEVVDPEQSERLRVMVNRPGV